MALELQEAFFGQFRGVRRRGSVMKMADAFAVEGSKNFYHPGDDEVTGIPGYTPLTSNPFSAAVRGMVSFRYESGGSPARKLLAVADDTLYDIDTSNGNETSLGSGLDASEIPQFAIAQDAIYIVSGGSANVKKYDGSTYGNVAETQPTKPTVASGATGNPSGVYYFKAVKVDSSGNEGPASAASDPIAVEGNSIDVTLGSLSAGEVWMVYATRGDNPNFFYFAGIATTTSFNFDLTNASLSANDELLRHGDPPPTGFRAAAWARDMLLLANRDGERSVIYASDIRNPDSFWGERTIFVSPQDGDEIVKLLPEFSRPGETSREMTAVIFKNWGIWNLFGTDFPSANATDPFRLEKSKSDVGTIGPNVVQVIPLEGESIPVFLAPDKTIRGYDGYNSYPLAGDSAREYLDDINLEHAHKTWSVHVPSLKMVFWQFPTGVNTEPNFGLGYDYQRNAFIPYPDWNQFRAAVLHYDTAENELIYAGESVDPDGGANYEVMQMFTGNDFDGTAIEWIWRSKPLLGQDGRTKTIEFIEPTAKKGSGSVGVKMWSGFKDPDTETPLLDTSFSTNESGRTHVKSVIPIQGSNGEFLVDEEATVQFRQSSTTAKDTILGFRLGFRRKRHKRFA